MQKNNSVVPPHNVLSVEVKLDEAQFIYEEANKMLPLMSKRIGFYNKHLAVSHPQINDKRPLRFFLINPAAEEFKDWKDFIIINPVMIRHTNNTVDSKEGCMSYSDMPMRTVQRYNKCEFEYSTLLFKEPGNEKDPLPYISERRIANLNGIKSKVFQHELDHLNAKYIYAVNLKRI